VIVDPGTLTALKTLASKLRIRDIGINAERREIYLLGTARSLNRTLRNWLIWSWQQRRGHDPEETWDRLEYTILDILGETNVPQPGPISENGPWNDGRLPGGDFARSWTVIPIPAPGGPQHTWWSAKTGRQKLPVKVDAYTLCSEERLSLGHASGPALLRLANSKLPPVFVSHGVSIDSLPRIRRCGGLLWPSLAITWKVPPSYGDIVLIADARLPTTFLAPLGRRDRDVVITASDSWSPSGGQLLQLEKAITWELRGDREWWDGHRSHEDGGYGMRGVQSELVYGSRDIDDLIGNWAPDVSKNPLRSMSQLWRRIKYLVDVHTRRSGVYEYEPHEELKAATTEHGDLYTYIEMKVRGVLSLDGFVACLYPSRFGVRVNRLLDDVGFQGWRIPFRWTGPLEKDVTNDSPERAAWASAATESLLKWAENPCESGVKVPSLMRSETRARYVSTAEYSLKRDFDANDRLHISWRSGYCGDVTTDR
jgi:hypothetical protein